MFDVTKVKIENTKQVLNGHVVGEVIDQNARALTAPGDNYLSLVLKVDFKVRRGDNIDTVETVAKFVPPGEFKKGKAETSIMTFRNEIVWYRDIVPLLADFEKECGVTGYTSVYPKYYGGRLNLENKPDMVDESAVVLLEYLKDYKSGDRHKGLDLETSKTIIKVLAKFHALPIALKLRKPELFKDKVFPVLGQITMQLPIIGEKKNPGPKRAFIDTVKECHEFDHLIPRIEKYLNPTPPFINKPIEPWSTISHNDFWVNNFMINPETNDVKILDFQGTSYRSFANDLLLFLFTSVASSVLNTNFKYLIRYYYDHFIEALKELNVATTNFTYDSYLGELKRELQEGQLAHVFIFTFVLKSQTGSAPEINMELPDPEKFTEIFSTNTSTPEIKEKCWDIVRICNDMNWI